MSAQHTPGPIWSCKIGIIKGCQLPNSADAPMRDSIENAYKAVTGSRPDFLFSGWSAELTEPELAVVEGRVPSEEYYNCYLLQDAAPKMLAACEAARLSLEHAAGCDENVNPDDAATEILSWAGSAVASAYAQIIDVIAKAKGGAA